MGDPQYSVKQRKAPKHYSNYVVLMSELIEVRPSIFKEASKHQVWKDAMVEYFSIMKNSVSEVALRPKDKSVMGSRWLYKIKHATDGIVKKFKSYFVAKGFSQKEGIDYDKRFSPRSQVLFHKSYNLYCHIDEVEDSPNGC